MSKKRFFLTVIMCIAFMMLFTITAFAYEKTNVQITIKTSTGVRNVTTTVGQVFETTASGDSYTITGIKAFGGYTLSAIKEVHIPYNAKDVKIIANNPYVEKLYIDAYTDMSITSMAGLTALKTINVSSNAKVSFKSNCSPVSIKEICLIGTGATAIFETSAFSGRISLTKLDFGSGGNTIKLGASCFQGIGVESLDLNDTNSFEFTGSGAFSSCSKLTYAYVGAGVKKLNNSPFDSCHNLGMVYIKAATEISDNTFRSSSAKVPLKVYVHTTAQVTIGANAFNGRSTLGVVVCALATDRTSFSNCKYELHYGLQHAYTPKYEEKTCYNYYETDCPCGKITNAKYKLYVSGKSEQIVELITGPNPDIPHDFSKAADMVYEDGIGSWGTVEMKCSVCENREGIVRPSPALFEFLGYSVSQTGVKSMTIGISFNSVVVDWYCDYMGYDVDYGVVASSVSALKGNAPLNNATGEAYNVKTVYKHDMTSLGSGNVKISGFNSASEGTPMVLAGYIRVGDKIFYIDNGGMKENVVGITYAQLLN